jgi:hypothetical protein
VRRPDHRTQWIPRAFEPIRDQLSDETCRRLSTALAPLIGIDPIVPLTDIAGASRENALDTLEWAARPLVEAGAPRQLNAG